VHRYESYDADGQRQCEMLAESLESEGWHVQKPLQMIWEWLPCCALPIHPAFHGHPLRWPHRIAPYPALAAGLRWIRPTFRAACNGERELNELLRGVADEEDAMMVGWPLRPHAPKPRL